VSISIPTSISQVLSTTYEYMRVLSEMLSILSISEDTELQASVRRGWIKIEFVDRPRVKYFVYQSLLETIVKIADSTAPPYIGLRVKDG